MTIDTEKERYEEEREVERTRRKKEKKRKKKEKEQRKQREKEEKREKEEQVRARGGDSMLLRLSDDESEVEDAKENTSPKKTKGIPTFIHRIMQFCIALSYSQHRNGKNKIL